MRSYPSSGEMYSLHVFTDRSNNATIVLMKLNECLICSQDNIHTFTKERRTNSSSIHLGFCIPIDRYLLRHCALPHSKSCFLYCSVNEHVKLLTRCRIISTIFFNPVIVFLFRVHLFNDFTDLRFRNGYQLHIRRKAFLIIGPFRLGKDCFVTNAN